MLQGSLPAALYEVIDQQFNASTIAMQIVNQRLFIGKVVPADVQNWLLNCDSLDDSAIAGFSHDDIDRGKQGLKGEWEGLRGVNSGISWWDWPVEEKAIGAQAFHLYKREGRQRNAAESH